MENLPTLITDREFAAILRLSPINGWRTIQGWARENKLKNIAVRIGDQWRFPLDKVQRWIENGGMK